MSGFVKDIIKLAIILGISFCLFYLFGGVIDFIWLS